MTTRFSRPVEDWTEPHKQVDVLIVGSGYGGSVAAYRLAHPTDRSVVVLERGHEYHPGDFPEGLGDVPGHVQFRRPNDAQAIGYPDGLYDIRFGDDVDVLVGSGLGGTSLINANVAVEPPTETFEQQGWPRAIADEARDPESRFRASFDVIRNLIGTAPGPATAKHEALKTLARSVGAECKPAVITVSLARRVNAAGITQEACTLCGNCVTGCNVGAKNTLAMTLIPLAHQRGARFFTGATVSSIEPARVPGYPWLVRYRRTATLKTPLAAETYAVLAKVVVLAAGTLGSTEILLRAREHHALDLSSELGKHFSTNGDALASGYAQQTRVDAMARTPQASNWSVGPTICGIAQVRADAPETGENVLLTIEDGAIPVALHHLFGELTTTGAQAARLVNVGLPAWYGSREGKAADPIAVHPGAMAHTQVLLMMGDDGARGRLVLHGAKDAAGNASEGHVKVVWEGAGNNPSLRAADALLAQEDRDTGFDGGQYVANPLWKILPDAASTVMSGKLPSGRVITVHPLGGCGMADDSDHGVVDDKCNVFAPGTPSGRHTGLYVLDGAVVPRALGVNPFLTISALAWRGCDAILAEQRWAEHQPAAVVRAKPVAATSDSYAAVARAFFGWFVWLQRRMVRPLVPLWPTMRVVPIPVQSRAAAYDEIENEVDIELSELLVGQLDRQPPVALFGELAPRLADYKGLLLRVSMKMPDVAGWYSNPGAAPLSARAALYAHPLSADRVRALHACELHRADLDKLTPLLTLEGEVRLFGRMPCGRVELWIRAINAIRAYFERRLPAKSIGSGLRAFWNVAKNHADYRTMTYEFNADVGSYAVRLTGRKLLAWMPSNRRIWSSLTTLPIELETVCGQDRESIEGTLGVHMEYLASDGVAQVTRTPHMPATVSAAAGIGMYFVRALLQTGFWEFGAPDYPDTAIDQHLDDWPSLNVPDGPPVVPDVTYLTVDLAQNDSRQVRIALSRYRQKGDRTAQAAPVLLIHGLAQGSLIYSTETMECNMASYFWQRGYDVWLLDYRLSNRILPHIESENWSIEDIARFDVTAAVKHVRDTTGLPVCVFSHCIGATALAMALLAGWVKAAWLRSIAFNAIHPWIMPSPVNRFRSALGGFFRDAVGRDLLDPIPQVHPSPAQVVLDRLAFSLGRYNEDVEQQHALDRAEQLPQAICDRMTFLYGRMWRHENLDPRTHTAFADMLGISPGSVYRHLYYFTRLGRVTDVEGQNIFLTEENIAAHWTCDTFFLHGELSEVFNPQSATRSAVRLRQAVQAAGRSRQRIWLRRVPGYGHMDVVFAKDAHQHVYPLLDAFFANDSSGRIASPDPYDATSDVEYAAPLDLTAGPIIRAAWCNGERVCVRLWGELHDDATSPSVGLEAVGAGTRMLGENGSVQLESRYRVLDLEIDDDYRDASIPVRGKIDTRITWPSGDKGVYFDWNLRSSLLDEGAKKSRRVAVSHRWSWLNRLRQRAQNNTIDEMHFLVGSCRYPGTMFERDAADAVFAGMERHLTDDPKGLTGVDMLFLVGDQIYADATAGLADSKSWRERYSARYREAFCAPNLKAVLASVPTHFAIDDHEFSDDWSGLPLPDDPLPVDDAANEVMKNAMHAAACFQSAARDLYPIGRQAAMPSPFWYPLDDSTECACPAFVMDTRTERRLRYAAGGNPRLIDGRQWQALRDWLIDAQKRDAQRPKFIFCGSVIAPVSRSYVEHPASFRNEDGWLGYPDDFAALARFIVDEGIENLVIVAGDLHFSAVTKLHITCGGREARVWHVVSSGLYAPMPFANAHSEDMALQGDIPVYGHDDIHLQTHGAVLCEGVSHFVRVDAALSGKRWQLRVSAHDAAGAAVTRGTPPPGVSSDGGAWIIAL